MRTDRAERVLTAARLILIRHGEETPVHPLPLQWARFVVLANHERRPAQERDRCGRFLPKVPQAIPVVDQALARRHALELAWMP
jgi:hypothetical protein